jgi:hypothetical protein
VRRIHSQKTMWNASRWGKTRYACFASVARLTQITATETTSATTNKGKDCTLHKAHRDAATPQAAVTCLLPPAQRNQNEFRKSFSTQGCICQLGRIHELNVMTKNHTCRSSPTASWPYASRHLRGNKYMSISHFGSDTNENPISTKKEIKPQLIHAILEITVHKRES